MPISQEKVNKPEALSMWQITFWDTKEKYNWSSKCLVVIKNRENLTPRREGHICNLFSLCPQVRLQEMIPPTCIVGNTNMTFKVFCGYIKNKKSRIFFYSRSLSWQKCYDDDDCDIYYNDNNDSNCHILIIY